MINRAPARADDFGIVAQLGLTRANTRVRRIAGHVDEVRARYERVRIAHATVGQSGSQYVRWTNPVEDRQPDHEVPIDQGRTAGVSSFIPRARHIR